MSFNIQAIGWWGGDCRISGILPWSALKVPFDRGASSRAVEQLQAATQETASEESPSSHMPYSISERKTRASIAFYIYRSHLQSCPLVSIYCQEAVRRPGWEMLYGKLYRLKSQSAKPSREMVLKLCLSLYKYHVSLENLGPNLFFSSLLLKVFTKAPSHFMKEVKNPTSVQNLTRWTWKEPSAWKCTLKTHETARFFFLNI